MEDWGPEHQFIDDIMASHTERGFSRSSHYVGKHVFLGGFGCANEVDELLIEDIVGIALLLGVPFLTEPSGLYFTGYEIADACAADYAFDLHGFVDECWVLDLSEVVYARDGLEIR